MLAVMLGELARREHWTWADVIDIQRRVLAYRLSVHDQVPRPRRRRATHLLAAVERHGLAGLPTSASTAHVSAVDERRQRLRHHDVRAATAPAWSIPGTGILLNNALGEPELNRLGRARGRPGHPARVQHGADHGPDAPRARRSPSAHPGADRITTALMQVLGQGCCSAHDLQHAIDAPRLHVRFMDDGSPRVEHEPSATIADAVRGRGSPAHEYRGPHMYFGGVGAAYRREEACSAAGDARREAAVAVLDVP